MLVGVLGVLFLVGKRRGQDHAVRKHYRVLIQFIIGVREFRPHALGDWVVLLAEGYLELVPFAVVALLAPAAGDDFLELLVKLAAADKRRRSVMVDHQSLAAADGLGEGLLVSIGPARLRLAVLGILVIEHEHVI